MTAESFTTRRLEHASAEHLHVTSRRAFIGPIPEGWLKGHRKQWYKHYVSYGQKRAPTFTAEPPISATDFGLSSERSRDEGDDARQGGRGVAGKRREGLPRSSDQSAEAAGLQLSDTATSSTSLLRSQRASATSTSRQDATSPQGGTKTVSYAIEVGEPVQRRATDKLSAGSDKASADLKPLAMPRVHFSEATKSQLRSRTQGIVRSSTFALQQGKAKDGEMLKVDRMLVRLDITQQLLGSEYDERAAQGVEVKSLDKWREFMVVCRRHVPKSEKDAGANAVLQLYQTRIIGVSSEQADKAKKKPKTEILLNPRTVKVNLFSSLDKTLCLWTLGGSRTTIYYLRPQSGTTSVEWYTFLRGALGAKRAQTLQVNVPDLSVTLRIDDPFRSLEHSQILAAAADGDYNAMAKVINDERGAAGAIVSRCFEMLKESPEWADVLKVWTESGHVGLAWKRYDRLEWLHGAAEQRMYGTIAMQRTHDLELRPKEHYPTITKPRLTGNRLSSDVHVNRNAGKSKEVMEEPPPVEGFLIRLTSQRGQERRLGRLLYKRLYFTTQSQHLVFLRPASAFPPPPPRLNSPAQNGHIPSAKRLAGDADLTYKVDPYPLRADRQSIAWLNSETNGRDSVHAAHDKSAELEADRNIKMLLACDGLINLCDIQRVRKMLKGATPADQNLTDGSDVEFDPAEGGIEFEQNRRQDDGQTVEVDEDRVFELLMKNGLVIRLQAYNRQTRDEWMHRLRSLVQYWIARTRSDMDLIKSVREQNLDRLQIDERAEAQVGSFAYKWEVSQSYASPEMYNMCGIAQCRTIHLSGLLYRKPRKHTTFTRCHVILAHGHLLIFQDTLRKRSGKKLVHIHHERIASISLKGSYLYSGLLTQNDLLYQNQTFDSNAPGHSALPRIYLEDGWTSTDEDSMTTFVVWHARSKSWFRSSRFIDDVRESQVNAERDARWKKAEESGEWAQGRVERKLTRVSQLGAKGRSVVFKARSRAERDHWVMAIQVEIERLAEQEQAEGGDVRLAEGASERKRIISA